MVMLMMINEYIMQNILNNRTTSDDTKGRTSENYTLTSTISAKTRKDPSLKCSGRGTQHFVVSIIMV